MKTNNIEENKCNKWQVNNMIYVWWSSILQCSNVVQGLARILSHWQEWIDVRWCEHAYITNHTWNTCRVPVFRYKNTENLSKTMDRGSFFLGSSLRLFNPQHDPSKTGLRMKLSELRPGSRRIFMQASRWPRTQIPKHHQTPKALGSAPGVKNQQSSQTMSDLYQIYLRLPVVPHKAVAEVSE